jgi:hypothetical protein
LDPDCPGFESDWVTWRVFSSALTFPKKQFIFNHIDRLLHPLAARKRTAFTGRWYHPRSRQIEGQHGGGISIIACHKTVWHEAPGFFSEWFAVVLVSLVLDVPLFGGWMNII